MRILVITAFYPPYHSGGYELRCKDVIDHLMEKGHEVIIITNRRPDPKCDARLDEDGIFRTLHLKQRTTHVFKQILHDCSDMQFIDRLAKKFRPEVIYLWHIQNLSNAILPYFSHQNIPIVFDEGGSGLFYLSKILNRGIYFYKNENDSIIKKWLKNSIYLAASLISSKLIKPKWSWPENMHVYFNSHSSAKHSQESGVPVKNPDVIHSGIKILKFPFVPRDSITAPLKIVTPGRIKPEKGTKDSILLVKKLIEENYEVQLLVVGEIQSKDYFEEINETIMKYGLSDVVRCLPMVTQDELAHIYQESDICFFPTYFKSGFSRVPLEAMASGCLVVTYGNEGSKEVVEDHKTGFIVSEGDVISAATLIEGLVKNPVHYQKMVLQARLQIEREHSMDRYIEKIEAYLYESLVKPNG
jgi:glycosyltransferase involved in cell wall biosynthesis